MLFDPTTTCSEVDPYPTYRRLRDECPVFHSVDGTQSAWVLSRFDDVDRALKDWRTFSSADSMPERLAAPGARTAAGGQQLITTDPPVHDKLRLAVKEHFAPRRILALEHRIVDEVARRLAPVHSGDTFDVAQDFAWPLTLAIISDIIGVPKDDRTTLLSRYQQLEYAEHAQGSAGELREYADYFDELASLRQKSPGDDLMSRLMLSAGRGEIVRADALMLCKDLFEGGVDVPANMITNSVLALAEAPEQARLLRGPDTDPARARLAIEELARYDPPIQYIPRVATGSVSWHDVEIPAGATVLLALGSANRDERRFSDPDTLDLTRPALRNIAFGAGIHFCIGAPLARLEAKLAVPALLDALGDYQIAEHIERPRGSAVMRGFLSLEVSAGRMDVDGDCKPPASAA